MSNRGSFVTVSVLLFVSICSKHVCGGVVVGLTQASQLISFDSGSPGFTSTPVAISGLLVGDTLLGIDVRPNTGMLYGLARNGTAGRLYTLNPASGLASLRSTIDQLLSGTNFGVDFNPVADRLRVVSDSGQNLRINVETGVSVFDGELKYNSGDVNFPTSPMVVASAYTNSFPNAASTTLYNLDLNIQGLVSQNPPNAGTLNTVGSLSTFGFPEASFDIESPSNTGFVVLNGFEFSKIDLATGLITKVGDINTTSNVIGIATNFSSVPEPTSLLLLCATVLGYTFRKKCLIFRRTKSKVLCTNDVAFKM